MWILCFAAGAFERDILDLLSAILRGGLGAVGQQVAVTGAPAGAAVRGGKGCGDAMGSDAVVQWGMGGKVLWRTRQRLAM